MLKINMKIKFNLLDNLLFFIHLRFGPIDIKIKNGIKKGIISLLKKGIAIHHAGIMPVLREMVELLFEKKTSFR